MSGRASQRHFHVGPEGAHTKNAEMIQSHTLTLKISYPTSWGSSRVRAATAAAAPRRTIGGVAFGRRWLLEKHAHYGRDDDDNDDVGCLHPKGAAVQGVRGCLAVVFVVLLRVRARTQR